jgi:hypothetical protein
VGRGQLVQSIGCRGQAGAQLQNLAARLSERQVGDDPHGRSGQQIETDE